MRGVWSVAVSLAPHCQSTPKVFILIAVRRDFFRETSASAPIPCVPKERMSFFGQALRRGAQVRWSGFSNCSHDFHPWIAPRTIASPAKCIRYNFSQITASSSKGDPVPPAVAKVHTSPFTKLIPGTREYRPCDSQGGHEGGLGKSTL